MKLYEDFKNEQYSLGVGTIDRQGEVFFEMVDYQTDRTITTYLSKQNIEDLLSRLERILKAHENGETPE